MGIAVVPRAGTWIETGKYRIEDVYVGVVPRAGTWIETGIRKETETGTSCRSPCGNVD